jgi:hypothetical protein
MLEKSQWRSPMVTRKPPLRAARPGEKAPKPSAPKNLKEAVLLSERDLLVMMRTKLASEIDSGVPPHTLAPLTRQLRDVDKEIRLLDAKAEQESDDDRARPDAAWDSTAL